MLATSEKIPTTEIIENACPECDGVGKKIELPNTEWSCEIECRHCLGEQVISEDLTIRKNLGKTLRTLLDENDLTRREASQKFSQSHREWNEAARGKASADDIRAKIVLIEKTFAPKRSRQNCVFTTLRGFPQ